MGKCSHKNTVKVPSSSRPDEGTWSDPDTGDSGVVYNINCVDCGARVGCTLD